MHARKWTFPERQMNLRLGSDLAFAGLQLSVVRSVAADTRPDLLFLAIIGWYTERPFPPCLGFSSSHEIRKTTDADIDDASPRMSKTKCTSWENSPSPFKFSRI